MIGEKITVYRFHKNKNKYIPIARGTVVKINKRFLSLQTPNYITDFNIVNFRTRRLAFKGDDGKLKTFKRLPDKLDQKIYRKSGKSRKPYVRHDFVLINSDYIRNKRSEQKLTLAKFSSMLKISIGSLQRIEQGDNQIWQRTFDRITAAECIDKDLLLEGGKGLCLV